jgi:hypothetical protein
MNANLQARQPAWHDPARTLVRFCGLESKPKKENAYEEKATAGEGNFLGCFVSEIPRTQIGIALNALYPA